MKDNRNNYAPQMFPFLNMQNMAQMGTVPSNAMMYPNYMNNNFNNIDTRVSSLEKKVKALENRISRLETPYQNNTNVPYQTTQNSENYNGEMYMM